MPQETQQKTFKVIQISSRHIHGSISIVVWENNVTFRGHFLVSKRSPGAGLSSFSAFYDTLIQVEGFILFLYTKTH